MRAPHGRSLRSVFWNNLWGTNYVQVGLFAQLDIACARVRFACFDLRAAHRACTGGSQLAWAGPPSDALLTTVAWPTVPPRLLGSSQWYPFNRDYAPVAGEENFISRYNLKF